MTGEHEHEIDGGGEGASDEELATLFRSMRDDRVPEELEEKLLAAVAVGGAAWAVKSGFFATLFAKLFAATKGSTAATVLGLGLAAAGSLAAVQIIATHTAPRPGVEAVRAATPVASSSPRSLPVGAPGVEAASTPPTASVASASPAPSAAPLVSAVPSAPVVSSVPSVRGATSVRESSSPEPALVAPALTASNTPSVVPSPDVLREEAGRVRHVADLVAAGRCEEAIVAIQAYRAKFSHGQLAQEMRVLEGRCSTQK